MNQNQNQSPLLDSASALTPPFTVTFTELHHHCTTHSHCDRPCNVCISDVWGHLPWPSHLFTLSGCLTTSSESITGEKSSQCIRKKGTNVAGFRLTDHSIITVFTRFKAASVSQTPHIHSLPALHGFTRHSPQNHSLSSLHGFTCHSP